MRFLDRWLKLDLFWVQERHTLYKSQMTPLSRVIAILQLWFELRTHLNTMYSILIFTPTLLLYTLTKNEIKISEKKNIHGLDG